MANFCVKIRSSIIRNSFSDTVNSLFFGFFITRFRRDLRSSRQIKALKSQTGPTHTQSLQPLHGLRTPNEGINQRNLKMWADVAQWYMRVRRVKIKVFKKLLFDNVST